MKNPCPIPTNFAIPKGYRRLHFLDSDTFQMKIEVSNGRLTLKQRRKENFLEIPAPIPSPEDSKCLDWIQQSMENIRLECEKLAKKRKKK